MRHGLPLSRGPADILGKSVKKSIKLVLITSTSTLVAIDKNI
jgi:hypothetical protein